MFLFPVNMIIVCGGMHYGWSSPYLPVLEHGNYTFQITSEESSYLAVTPAIGELFGALAILLIDFVGRKNLIVFSALPFIAAWIIVGFATSATVMFAGRFISGIADGMIYNVVPVYMGEIASPKIRGQLSSLSPVAAVLGFLLIYTLGAYLPLNTSSFITILCPAVVLLASPWIPESPYYYLMKGKTKEARESLRFLRGKEDVTDEVDRMFKAVEEQNENKGKFLDLITVRSNRKGLLISLGRSKYFKFS